MHLVFGNLAKIRGIVYYRISPHHQKVFHGMFNPGVPNLIRRARENVFKISIPFACTYLLIQWANAENERLSRKNPKDYENDT